MISSVGNLSWEFFNQQKFLINLMRSEQTSEFRHSGVCVCIVGEASHPRYVEPSATIFWDSIGSNKKSQQQRLMLMPWCLGSSTNMLIIKMDWFLYVFVTFKKNGYEHVAICCPKNFGHPRTDSMLKGRPIFVRQQLRLRCHHGIPMGSCVGSMVDIHHKD